MDARADTPGRDDVQPVANETLDRIATGTVTAAPVIALVFVGWQLWEDALYWHDLVVFLILYAATGLGITVGFHRLLTHRSFKTKPWLRGTFAALGSAAIEGPVIAWVADHRKHHAFSDQEGDPHSPHVDHGGGFRGALKGLMHAHVGLALHPHPARQQGALRARPAQGPGRELREPHVLPVGARRAGGSRSRLGVAIGGDLKAGLTGLLWGGAVRMLVLHHVTYSINSLCHFFGRRRFPTDDESRNLAWLAPLSFGEAWHNNHHAFPTSARHGLRPWEIDFSAMVIRGLEATGLAWDVQRVPRERQLAKAAAPG